MSDQNDFKSHIPSWLTKEYVGKIFSQYVKCERNEEDERNIDIDLFEKSVDNIGIQLFRVKATNKKDSKDVYKAFMKIISETPTNTYNISNQSQIYWFTREGEMYEDFIKYITGILSKNMPEVVLPKLYHYSEEPFCLVIEDMTYHGYEIYKGTYTLENCIDVFRNIARFHALSYYAHHQLKKDFTKYNNTFVPKDNVPVIVSGSYRLLLEVVKTWEGCLEYAEKLEKFEPFYTDSVARCLDSNSPGEGYNVLAYGDIHKNNILFNKDKTKCLIVSGLIFPDFFEVENNIILCNFESFNPLTPFYTI